MLKHTLKDKNDSNGPAFLRQKFYQNHFEHQNRLKIHIEECKWLNYQYNFFLFHPYCIIKAIFNNLNLRLTQKIWS